MLFEDSTRYDLLLSDEFARLSARPSILREEITARGAKGFPVIIDEVQKIPSLMDEIHWLMENRGIQFILSGSSPRKLKRSGTNLLGGRAPRYELFPLVYKEIPGFDLLRALNNGLIPRHYLADDPRRLLQSYVGDYLKEEIAAEALTRNIPAFARFLEVAAISNGEIVNQNNIAAECGVSAPTVKEYFTILEDTLIGRFVPSYRLRPKRRVIQASKFYFFDVGIVNTLLKRGKILPRSELFGRAFEHFIMQEIFAHSHYSGLSYNVSYWRTASRLEVDFIIGNHEVAIEVKGKENLHARDMNGIEAFGTEYRTKHRFVVSLVPRERVVDGITIIPWKQFLDRLWGGAIIR